MCIHRRRHKPQGLWLQQVSSRYFPKIFIHLCVFCVCLCLCLCTHNIEVRGCLSGAGSSFHHVGSRNQTQVVRPGGKCHYLLSHLTGPKFAWFYWVGSCSIIGAFLLLHWPLAADSLRVLLRAPIAMLNCLFSVRASPLPVLAIWVVSPMKYLFSPPAHL